MHIKYVASNVKGGVRAALGEKTLIIGDNATGKSSVVGAIELALTGAVSDVAGRAEMKKENELITQLAPEGKGELFSNLLLDDGTEVKWIAGAKGAKKAQHYIPEAKVDTEAVFPLRPVTEAIMGNPQTARKFFMGFILPKLTREDVYARIPKTLHEHYQNAILKAGINDPEVDKLLLALEFADSKSRGAKTKARTQKETATVVSEGLAPLPTSEVIEAVKAKQKTSRKKLEELIQLRAQAAQVQKTQADAGPIRAQLGQAQANIQQLQAALAQVDAHLAQTPRPAALNEHTLRVMAIVEQCAALEAAAPGTGISCHVCKTPMPAGTFTQRHQVALAYKEQEAAKAGPFMEIQKQRDGIQSNLVSWRQHAISLETQLSAIQQVVAAGGGGGEVVTDEMYLAAQREVSLADDEMLKITTLQAQWETTQRVEATAKDSDKESDVWAELSEACSKTIDQLLGAGVSQFVAKVQSFLPATDKFELVLHENKKPVFRIGLHRDGRCNTALSGAEWSRVMAAVAAACIVPGKLSVIIPPDRSFDTNTVTTMLHSFVNVPGQVIIATTTPPREIPVGWTVINTNIGQHKQGNPN